MARPLEVYPTPLSGNTLTVKYNGTEKAKAALYDAQGRLLNTMLLKPGNNEVVLNHLSRGTYWIKLLGRVSEHKAISFIKQ